MISSQSPPRTFLGRGFAITPSVGHARTPRQSERLRNGHDEISCTLVIQSAPVYIGVLARNRIAKLNRKIHRRRSKPDAPRAYGEYDRNWGLGSTVRRFSVHSNRLQMHTSTYARPQTVTFNSRPCRGDHDGYASGALFANIRGQRERPPHLHRRQ